MEEVSGGWKEACGGGRGKRQVEGDGGKCVCGSGGVGLGGLEEAS